MKKGELKNRRISKKTGKKKRTKKVWTESEDQLLLDLIDNYGAKKWSLIAKHIKDREGKQCRERWYNHLDPDISKSPWTSNEEWNLFLLQKLYNTRWCVIAKKIKGRTDNAIKNHWNSIMKKKMNFYQQKYDNLSSQINSGKINVKDLSSNEKECFQEFFNGLQVQIKIKEEQCKKIEKIKIPISSIQCFDDKEEIKENFEWEKSTKDVFFQDNFNNFQSRQKSNLFTNYDTSFKKFSKQELNFVSFDKFKVLESLKSIHNNMFQIILIYICMQKYSNIFKIFYILLHF